MNGKIFLVEGYEYTGKTELCKNLVNHYGGIYFHCPYGKSDITKSLYDIMKIENIDERTKLLTVLATHVENILTINKLKNDGETVIVDRSLLSAFAYQKLNFENFKIMLNIIDMPLLEIDEVFFLTASVEELERRMVNRQDKKETLDDYFFVNKERIINKYNDYYDVLYSNPHKVSTTNKNQKEVLKRVIQIIDRTFQNETYKKLSFR